ncbi:MAG: pantoate--beta-alanine ligase, partial [Luteolibacter sp.]
MIQVTSIDEIRNEASARGGSAGPRVLVPTMGALHAGHISLIKQAREIAGTDGTVIVSIFVNPIQFDRKSDFEQYPHSLERDLDSCRAAGADIVFTPHADEIYHSDRSVIVHESSLSQSLCGASRPGHFDGVCTIVLKLFLLTACDFAIFGEKDFQQLAIIRRMVRDLNVPVKIVSCPTLREADGLAMSSRNVRLDADQRSDAPRIYQALCRAAMLQDPAQIIAHARWEIEAS